MAEIKLNKDLQNYVDRLDKENLDKIRSAFNELVEFFTDNRFVSSNLLTVEKDSEKKYPQNQFFNQIITSSDKKEESQWEDLHNNIDRKFFDYHLPIDGNIVPINKRLFVPKEYQNDVKNNKWIVPVDIRRENMLKKLQDLNYYDKEGKRTKKELPETDIFANPPAKNKKKFLKDINLILGYENSFHTKDEDDIDYMPSDIETLQLEELLPKALLNKTLLWKSDIKSPAPQFRLVGEGGPFDDLNDGQDSRDFKISKIKYPVLHPRVKKYLSLVKKYLSTILKTNQIPYSAIEIIPRSSSTISVFIISDYAKKYYQGQFDNKASDDSIYLALSLTFEIIKQISDLATNGWAKSLDVEYMVIKKDKSLRFQSIMSKRLKRIKKDILSLNQLHNKKNYIFEENDFSNALFDINQALGDFESKYKDYFSTNKKTKDNQEIAEVFARLNKNQKQQLISLINEEKK